MSEVIPHPVRNAGDSADLALATAKAGVFAVLRKTEMTARIAYPKVSFSFRTMGCKSYRELKAADHNLAKSRRRAGVASWALWAEIQNLN